MTGDSFGAPSWTKRGSGAPMELSDLTHESPEAAGSVATLYMHARVKNRQVNIRTLLVSTL